MKSILVAVAFVILAIPTVALAGWTGAVPILDIETSDTSTGGTGPANVYIHFSTAPVTTTCSLNTSGAGQWLVGGTADSAKNILTVATAAKLSGRKVTVFWNSGGTNACSGGGTTGYPVVTGLDIQ